jgi:hypothetical protein
VKGVGRNDPCPCGSGAKYKKCCLVRQPPPPGLSLAPALTRSVSESPAPLSTSRPAPSPAPTEKDISWDDAVWDGFFKELERAPVEEKARLAAEAIGSGRALDGDLAFEIVEALVDPLRRAGRAEEIDDVIRRIEELHPDAFDAESPWMNFCLVENALLRTGGDLLAPLAALAERIERSIDEFCRLSDRLRYHGRVEALPGVMLGALPKVMATSEITEAGKWEFKEVAFSLLLDEHLARDPRLCADDPVFLDRTAPVREMDEEWLGRVVAHASGQSERGWRPNDFTGTGGKKFGENVFLLTLEFGLRLHAEWGWPRSRAELGRVMTNRYLGERRLRRAGRESGERDASGAGRTLHPDPAGVERFMVSHLSPLGPQPYRVAAFGQAVPLWSKFLVERGLTDKDAVPPLERSLRKRCRDLPALLDSFVYDPVLVADVSRALGPGL